MSGIKVDRLLSELDFIKANLALWEQGDWFESNLGDSASEAEVERAVERLREGLHPCGSTGCLAGNSAIHARLVDVRVEVWSVRGETYRYLEVSPMLNMSWAEAGQTALGLTDRQRGALFAGGNSLWRLYALAQRMTSGQITIPDDVTPDPVRGDTPGDTLCAYCRREDCALEDYDCADRQAEQS